MQSSDAPITTAAATGRRTSNDESSDKVSPPIVSSSGRGFKDFFRKRQKSASSSSSTTGALTVDVDCCDASLLRPPGQGGSHSATCSPSERTSPKPLLVPDSPSTASGGVAAAYGNYLTISGTGANALQDLFQKKYRTSYVSESGGSGERTRSGSGGASRKLAPLFTQFKFRSSKRSADSSSGTAARREEWLADQASRSSSDSRTLREMFRNRNRSGGPTGSSSGGGTRVRTFFDSFRQRSKTLTESYQAVVGDEASSASAGASFGGEQQVPKLQLKKNKKFKVTLAQESSARVVDVDPLLIGPNEYFQMYRSRANSDPKLEARYDTRATVENCRQSKFSAISPAGQAGNTSMSFGQARVVIWKDRRKGTRVFTIPKQYEADLDIGDDDADMAGVEDLSFAKFMKFHKCYDVMPASSKLVVFDTELKVKKAFFALVQNGVRAAPLWDTVKQDFVGMLTITDFIQILQKYYRSPDDAHLVSQASLKLGLYFDNPLEHMEELEEHKIATWRDVLHESDRPMIDIDPEASLLDAVRSLCMHKVHRLLVVDGENGNALHILTHRRILKFLHLYMHELPQPQFMEKSIGELKIGTYENIATVSPDMPIIRALNLFVERRISALPVVSSDGTVIDIYAKFDVFALAAEKSYNNLELTVSEATKKRKEGEGTEVIHTCMKSDSLTVIVNKIVAIEVHRLIVVDSQGRVDGIVSLSDILHYIIIHPLDVRKQKIEELREKTRLVQEAKDKAAATAAKPATEAIPPADLAEISVDQSCGAAVANVGREETGLFVINPIKNLSSSGAGCSTTGPLSSNSGITHETLAPPTSGQCDDLDVFIDVKLAEAIVDEEEEEEDDDNDDPDLSEYVDSSAEPPEIDIATSLVA